MRLSLVGMSGSGKSFWSKKLFTSGFLRLCCDDLIAGRLSPELGKRADSVAAVGSWMGFPFEPRYKEREAAYLACEKEVMTELLQQLGKSEGGAEEKIVVDTTGSVIYVGDETLAKLRNLTTIVHLATPLEIQKAMLEAYIKRPRPVLWREVFLKRSDEDNAQALARCYPQLLASRERQYEKLAHVTISHYHHRRAGFGMEEFLDILQTKTG
jgi:shikimate kinase